MILNEVSLQLRRESPRVLDPETGIYETATTTTYNIAGNWQPAGKDDIQLLPEGIRDRNTMLLMTNFFVQLNDIIVDGTKEFRVHEIQNFATFRGSVGRYEAVCVEVKE